MLCNYLIVSHQIDFRFELSWFNKNMNFIDIVKVYYYIAGVAKLLDSPSHFSKFEIVHEPQLNTLLKGMQKRY